MRRSLIPLLLPALAMACSDGPTVTAPLAPGGPALTVSDALHSGGNARFFFLPPLVPQPTVTGTFDASLSPVVEVCEWTGECGAVVARFTTLSGIGGATVRVDVDNQHYIVNWDTRECVAGPCTLDPAKTYRLAVRVAETQLGFADVDVVGNGTQLKNAQTNEYIGLVNGRTLPVKFRIERSDPFDFIYRDQDGIHRWTDGVNLLVFPLDRGEQQYFEWSPNAEEVAWVASDDSGRPSIYRGRLDGGGVVVVAGGPACCEFGDYPAWSPDGTRLAYIYQNDFDGINTRDHRHLRIHNLVTGEVTDFLDLSRAYVDGPPRWSPDGRYIALVGSGQGPVVLEVATGEHWMIDATRTAGAYGYANRVMWSPDGRRLAYKGADEGVWVVNVDGSSARRVYCCSPYGLLLTYEWSPTSEEILFQDVDEATNRVQFRVVNADGSGLRLLLPDYAMDQEFPSWSPDGRWIVFWSTLSGVGGAANFVVRSDGTELQQLPNVSGVYLVLWWNPTLKRLP